MNEKNIFLTDNDKKRLLTLIRSNTDRSNTFYLKKLEDEVNRANVVSSKEIFPDVVTMNSKVVFTFIENDDEMTYQLVFPEDADIDKGKISILAPIGTALLGYRIGDIIEWDIPAGKTKVKVKDIIYQPEKAGDYHL